MADFRMPSLGADMEAGTLVEWKIHPGDAVHRGDIVAVVETEKGAIDLEIWQDGVVEEILVEVGRKVPVDTPLARLRGGSEPATASVPAAPAAPATATPPVSAQAPAASARSSPVARRRARELGVDLAAIRGTGPDGAITLADVEKAATTPAPAAAPPSKDAERAAAMRRAIASAMARSKREIPHYYLSTEIDLARALAWIARTNADRPPAERILPAALLVRAVAKTLPRFPELNGFWIDGSFRPSEAVHVGVAISLRGGGLVAPAIRDAQTKSVDEVMAALGDVTARARAGALRSSELSDPTITVTNLGDRGVETVFGVIYPPQVAIVGFGRVTERPRSEGGAIVSRPVVTAALSGDHRASDGHRGALFLAAVAQALQEEP